MRRAHLLLLMAGMFLTGWISLTAQNIYLVSVGISDYPGIANDLHLPAADARAINRLYKKNALVSSVLLTDSNATREKIKTSAKRLFAKANPADIVVFFFSGHGYEGGYYVYDGYLPYEDVRSFFSGCKAKNKMMFIDACYSGGIRRNGHGGERNSGSNIMLLMSSRTDEVSLEQSRMRNGLFTTCLLRSLKGGADYNHDRIITAKELFKSVSSGVKQLSADHQHPVMWGNFDDSMPVMIWK